MAAKKKDKDKHGLRIAKRRKETGGGEGGKWERPAHSIFHLPITVTVTVNRSPHASPASRPDTGQICWSHCNHRHTHRRTMANPRHTTATTTTTIMAAAQGEQFSPAYNPPSTSRSEKNPSTKRQHSHLPGRRQKKQAACLTINASNVSPFLSFFQCCLSFFFKNPPPSACPIHTTTHGATTPRPSMTCSLAMNMVGGGGQ